MALEDMFIARAYDPKVTVRNNIFPPFEELINCTTCRKGRKLPSELFTDNEYHRQCTWDGHEHIGFNYLDIDCPNFIREIRK